MRRAAVLLVLASCQALNTFDESLIPEKDPRPLEVCDNQLDDDGDELIDCRDPGCAGREVCLELSEPACLDGRDNDADGLTDCDDDACFEYFDCFATLPFSRAERCPPARDAFELIDRFTTELDPELWTTFSTSEDDRPRHVAATFDGAIDLGGRDGVQEAGIFSTDTFGVGTEQHFQLFIQLVIDAGCEAPDAPERCQAAIDLHTREAWSDLAQGGESILGVRFLVTKTPGEVDIECTYHERPIRPDFHPRYQSVVGQPFSVHLDGTTQDGVRVYVGTSGEPACVTPPLQALEPPTHLVFRAGGMSAAGRVLLDSVMLEVRPERVGGACQGRTIGRPVLEDGYCDESVFFNRQMIRPKVARFMGHYDLLFHGAGGAAYGVGHARSRSDGRTDWKLTRGAMNPNAFETLADPSESTLGAVVFNEALDRLEAWAPSNFNSALWIARADSPVVGEAPHTYWWGENFNVVDMSPPPDQMLDAARSFHPETVVLKDGVYEAWYAATSNLAEGRTAIYLARSSDGVSFQSHPDPVLSPGRGEWDLEGVYAPSVVWTGSHYLMAYSAKSFFAAPAIGLAASRDGVTWVKHGANPILTGEDENLDDGGAHMPSILYEDGVLRIWYAASTFDVKKCTGNPALTTGEQTRIALAELVLPRSSTISTR